MKKGFDAVWLVVLFAGIVTLFWNNEFLYGIATRTPKEDRRMVPFEQIDLKEKTEHGNHPFFMHIFNPYCPCSRYNISFFKSRFNKNGKKDALRIIQGSADNHFATQQINKPVLYDY